MFGIRKKAKVPNRSKAEERQIDQKENEATWSYLESAKRQSDRDAERGGR